MPAIRSDNRFVTYKGKRLTLPQWSAETGISAQLLRYRLRSGWTIGEALTTPARQYVKQTQIDLRAAIQAYNARLTAHVHRQLTAFVKTFALAWSRHSALHDGHIPGEGENFPETLGTGAGSAALDRAKIDFLQAPEPKPCP